MAAQLTSRIEWVVLWVVDGDTMGERYAEAESAAEHVAYLESQAVQVWVERVEYFPEAIVERGIAGASEWIATPGQEPGQLWEREAERDSAIPLAHGNPRSKWDPDYRNMLNGYTLADLESRDARLAVLNSLAAFESGEF